MINTNYIAVFDFETCNLRKDLTSPIQIAAIMLHPRTLEFVDGGEFCSLMKPIDELAIEQKALDVNRKTIEELREAPEQKIVWEMFVDFVKRYNKKDSVFTAPIPAGHNINNFDMPIIDCLCKHYGNVDNKTKEQNIFSSVYTLDTLQIMFYWFESLKEPEKYNKDYMCEYLGFSQEERDKAHDALEDCKITAKILKRFLEFSRNHAKRTTFKERMAK